MTEIYLLLILCRTTNNQTISTPYCNFLHLRFTTGIHRLLLLEYLFPQEQTRPDYVVLTLHIGKPHKKTPQENPIRKPRKKIPQESPTRTTKYKVNKKENREGEILEFCLQAKSCSEILEYLGLKDRKNLMETYLNPLISKGLLGMTEPGTPRSRNQKYKTITRK